jgi:hypothetical protein
LEVFSVSQPVSSKEEKTMSEKIFLNIVIPPPINWFKIIKIYII